MLELLDPIAGLIDPVAGTAQTLAGRLAGASLAFLAIALVLHTTRLSVRARAWHNIARAAFPDAGLRFRHSLGAYLCGAGTNAVLPARPGELLKLTMIRRNAPDTSYQGLASTLITESVFDTLTAVAGVAAAVALGLGVRGSVPVPAAFVAGHPWLAGGAGALVAASFLLMRRHLGRRLAKLTSGASRGFQVLRRPKRYLVTVVSWQALALGLRFASTLCFLAAFHVPATLQTALLVFAAQSLANLIPLTPNGAGTQQALLVVALGTTAGAASVVGFGAGAQLAVTLVDVVLALVSLVLLTGSVRWRGLVEPEPAEPAPAFNG
jgi:uncharacterized membrane protein YbhN (UPF0104 family)